MPSVRSWVWARGSRGSLNQVSDLAISMQHAAESIGWRSPDWKWDEDDLAPVEEEAWDLGAEALIDLPEEHEIQHGIRMA